MKKITLIMIALIFTSFFISCKKEEANNQSLSGLEPTKIGNQDPIKVGCENFITKYIPEEGEYCTKSGTNCAPCFIVYGALKSNLVLEGLYAIVGGTTYETVTFFSNKDNVIGIFPYLLEDAYCNFLKAMVSGNYRISKTVKSKSGSNVIFIAQNVNDNSELAFPISLKE